MACWRERRQGRASRSAWAARLSWTGDDATVCSGCGVATGDEFASLFGEEQEQGRDLRLGGRQALTGCPQLGQHALHIEQTSPSQRPSLAGWADGALRRGRRLGSRSHERPHGPDAMDETGWPTPTLDPPGRGRQDPLGPTAPAGWVSERHPPRGWSVGRLAGVDSSVVRRWGLWRNGHRYPLHPLAGLRDSVGGCRTQIMPARPGRGSGRSASWQRDERPWISFRRDGISRPRGPNGGRGW